ncbi:ATP-binding protein [Candidatus Entotheonella palauensis]|uniref:ATP-binding protein n=1 Tax=Candidatus Entotheonella palauensis TaxID=93172 RepID=UPI000B7D49B1|nr:adenylate/guanylate cyclase domain-containing protein [Candidatus Entotheonella palauensis]
MTAIESLTIPQLIDEGLQLAVRIGIHTGPVVVGDIGTGATQERLALGETPNVAARIQGVAQPDTVVISGATHQLALGYFECEALGEHLLRGVADPVAVYRVLSEIGAQSRLDVTFDLTPMVSRESEIALLVERWQQTITGMGQVVVVSGEAGIGKSRLVKTLKEQIIDRTDIRWECRSSPYYQNTTLYPLMDLLQRTSGFTDHDRVEKKLEKLEQTLGQYRFPLEETIPLFASFFSLALSEERYPTLNLTPQQQRQKTLEMTLAILLEHAEQQLVLFILEDLHWTDPTTLEFLELLIEQIPTVPVLTVLTCRPTHCTGQKFNLMKNMA